MNERFPTSLNQETHQICIMDFASHRGITLILFGRSAIQLICVYDINLGVPFHSIAQNLIYLRNVKVANFIWSN